MVFEGSCHCGALKASFETAQSADALEVRADQCSFCKARGGKTVSDPQGKLTLRFTGAGAHPYRFGLKTSDFWICNSCGAYIAATAEVDGRLYGVLNVAAAGIASLAGREAKPVNYDAEDATSRQTRRAVRWTPTEIRGA